MAKGQKAVEGKSPAMLREQFLSTLGAANKREPPKGALEAFRQTVKECRREGVAPWRDATDPLDAALAVLPSAGASKLTSEAVAEL